MMTTDRCSRVTLFQEGDFYLSQRLIMKFFTALSLKRASVVDKAIRGDYLRVEFLRLTSLA